MVGSSGAGPHRVHRKEAFPADDGSEGVGSAEREEPAEGGSTRWPYQGHKRCRS